MGHLILLSLLYCHCHPREQTSDVPEEWEQTCVGRLPQLLVGSAHVFLLGGAPDLSARHVLHSPLTTVFHAHYALPSVFRAAPSAQDNRTSSPLKYRWSPLCRRGPIVSREGFMYIYYIMFIIKYYG